MSSRIQRFAHFKNKCSGEPRSPTHLAACGATGRLQVSTRPVISKRIPLPPPPYVLTWTYALIAEVGILYCVLVYLVHKYYC